MNAQGLASFCANMNLGCVLLMRELGEMSINYERTGIDKSRAEHDQTKLSPLRYVHAPGRYLQNA